MLLFNRTDAGPPFQKADLPPPLSSDTAVPSPRETSFVVVAPPQHSKIKSRPFTYVKCPLLKGHGPVLFLRAFPRVGFLKQQVLIKKGHAAFFFFFSLWPPLRASFPFWPSLAGYVRCPRRSVSTEKREGDSFLLQHGKKTTGHFPFDVKQQTAGALPP